MDVPARPIEPLRPAYPPGLRALGLEGEVEARVIVWADGSLRGGRILRSSHEAFETAVRDSLAQARFAPAERAGRPVPSTVTLVLRFRLDR